MLLIRCTRVLIMANKGITCRTIGFFLTPPAARCRCCAHFRPLPNYYPLSLKSLPDCLIPTPPLIQTPPPHLTLILGGSNLAGVRIWHNTGSHVGFLTQGVFLVYWTKTEYPLHFQLSSLHVLIPKATTTL